MAAMCSAPCRGLRVSMVTGSCSYPSLVTGVLRSIMRTGGALSGRLPEVLLPGAEHPSTLDWRGSNRPPVRHDQSPSGGTEAGGTRDRKLPGMQITELKELIAESSGDPVDTIDSTQSFLDMGYDSLMVLEMAALLKNRHGVELSDDDHVLTQTPEDLLAVVNGAKA
ncbi:hypothetical protein CGZ98_03630 [Enemella evansiae]|nr:hypothetical protein CGZ98_03630 [Enemella evansiae]